jgi:hypothetical protein
MKSYRGSCFCGDVEFTVTGEPAVMGYCHCNSCRQWSAAPVNAFTLWQPEAVKFTKGEDKVGVYHKSELSYRKWCKSCGGHLLTVHPPWKLVDVYASVLSDFPYKPGLHVNYGNTVLRMHDGLPKLGDLPKEMGGTGAAVPE